MCTVRRGYGGSITDKDSIIAELRVHGEVLRDADRLILLTRRSSSYHGRALRVDVRKAASLGVLSAPARGRVVRWTQDTIASDCFEAFLLICATAGEPRVYMNPLISRRQQEIKWSEFVARLRADAPANAAPPPLLTDEERRLFPKLAELVSDDPDLCRLVFDDVPSEKHRPRVLAAADLILKSPRGRMQGDQFLRQFGGRLEVGAETASSYANDLLSHGFLTVEFGWWRLSGVMFNPLRPLHHDGAKADLGSSEAQSPPSRPTEAPPRTDGGAAT
jgi:hypothetical protein